MTPWLDHLGLDQYLTSERMLDLTRALLTLIVGLIVARLVSRSLAKVVATRTSLQESMLVRRLSFYVLLGLALASTLHQLGFQLGVLLGAAGILTVAVGFASQTSVSNLISGLFLIAERSFQVGDAITVDNVTGEVLSIDLLSVKLRTFDNLFVRVPNESVIKSRVTNLTQFPIRRIDLQLGVAYNSEMSRVREILFSIADLNPFCLTEPKPIFIFQSFGESALEFQFSVWAKRENFLDLKNTILQEIKAGFDAEGIEIPFPHCTLYAGTDTPPLPVTLVE